MSPKAEQGLGLNPGCGVPFGAGVKAGYWGAFCCYKAVGDPGGAHPRVLHQRWCSVGCHTQASAARAGCLRGTVMSVSNFGCPAWQLSVMVGMNPGLFWGTQRIGQVCTPGKRWCGCPLCVHKASCPSSAENLGFSRLAPTLPSQAAYTCLFVFDCLRFSEFD